MKIINDWCKALNIDGYDVLFTKDYANGKPNPHLISVRVQMECQEIGELKHGFESVKEQNEFWQSEAELINVGKVLINQVLNYKK